jgi:hypothetical protein
MLGGVLERVIVGTVDVKTVAWQGVVLVVG